MKPIVCMALAEKDAGYSVLEASDGPWGHSQVALMAIEQS